MIDLLMVMYHSTERLMDFLKVNHQYKKADIWIFAYSTLIHKIRMVVLVLGIYHAQKKTCTFLSQASILELFALKPFYVKCSFIAADYYPIQHFFLVF